LPPTNDLPLRNVRPRIRVDGNLRANLGEATLSMQIHLPRIGMSSAELRLLNWGPTSTGQPDFLFQTISLGNQIELLLDESSDTPAFRGEITAIEERYGDGAPQIVILAEDRLHRPARIRHNRVFEDSSLSDLVQRIANEAGLQSDVSISSATSTWLQVNESDLAFLQRQLAPYDVCLRLQDDALRVRDDEPDSQPVSLDPATALNIRIIADLNHQTNRLSVKGYSLEGDSEADSTQSSLSPAPNGTTAAECLQDLGWEGDSTLPHPFARSQQEAEMLATRQYRQSAHRFLHGEIICQGNGSLRAGREVELNQVSPRLAGRYRVMECWHQFDLAQGFRTRIRVQRPDWNV